MSVQTSMPVVTSVSRHLFLQPAWLLCIQLSQFALQCDVQQSEDVCRTFQIQAPLHKKEPEPNGVLAFFIAFCFALLILTTLYGCIKKPDMYSEFFNCLFDM
jgi:hypothetical protein